MMSTPIDRHPKAAVAIAFTTGLSIAVLLNLGLSAYVFRQNERRDAEAASTQRAGSVDGIFSGPRISMQDHTKSGTENKEKLRKSSVVSNAANGIRGMSSSTTHACVLPAHLPPISPGLAGTIGNTPLIILPELSRLTGRQILAKAEFLNGAGNSPKDRVALGMIREAESKGLLVPHRGDTIYEGTVGSTGISLAAVGRSLGYRVHICMPSDVATEKSQLLLALGATVERVPPASIVDSNQFVNMARKRAVEHSTDFAHDGVGFFADQFENEANWRSHYRTTAPEIWMQTEGNIDAFVAGAGTGGTISGVARYFRDRVNEMREQHVKPDQGIVKIVLADPQGSGLYNRVKYNVMFSSTEREGTRRRHQVDTLVEGIGCNRSTANFEAGRELIQDAIRVTDNQAMKMARLLVEKEGLFCGSSSAVNVWAAVKAAMGLPEGSRVVTILCDSGTRHLSKFWKEAGMVGGDENMTLEEVMGD